MTPPIRPAAVDWEEIATLITETAFDYTGENALALERAAEGVLALGQGFEALTIFVRAGYKRHEWQMKTLGVEPDGGVNAVDLRIAAIVKENADLRAALAPFAECGPFTEADGTPSSPETYFGYRRLQVGHFDRARELVGDVAAAAPTDNVTPATAGEEEQSVF